MKNLKKIILNKLNIFICFQNINRSYEEVVKFNYYLFKQTNYIDYIIYYYLLNNSQFSCFILLMK